MSYVIAAYGVTIVALGGYALHLLRDRTRLARTRSGGAETGPGANS